MLKCKYSKFGAISALSTVSSYAYSKNMAACCAHILGAVHIGVYGGSQGQSCAGSMIDFQWFILGISLA